MIGDRLEIKPSCKTSWWMLTGEALAVLMSVDMERRFILEHPFLVLQPTKTARFMGFFGIFWDFPIAPAQNVIQ